MAAPEWFRLAFWTLVCGTLAAGSANAINQYLDRDIDLLMTRTRRRPLPAHAVTPENALVFGIVLGVISIVLMAWFVNLVAAFLTLLAIGFYVFVYTLMLKRTTPQNIVIGGAAGALPPVIGWAAVTGRVEIPALLLFALVFYWTPPHFWALVAPDPQGLRGGQRADAAGGPRRPRDGAPDRACTRVLLVAISLVFYAVAHMGPIYLVAAVVLGGDLPVARLRAVAPGDVARGLARPGDPPVQVLDQLPHAAVRGGRDRQPARRHAQLSDRRGEADAGIRDRRARRVARARSSPSPWRSRRRSSCPGSGRVARSRRTAPACRRRSRTRCCRATSRVRRHDRQARERQPLGDGARRRALAQRRRAPGHRRSSTADPEAGTEPRPTSGSTRRVATCSRHERRAVLRGQRVHGDDRPGPTTSPATGRRTSPRRSGSAAARRSTSSSRANAGSPPSWPWPC